MDVELLVERLGAPCAELGVEVVDAELLRGGAGGRSSSVLRVTVERPGVALDLDAVAAVSAVVSAVLDAEEQLAPSGHFDLEVTSPGLERRLRRPEHFRRVVGSEIAVKTRPGSAGERRVQGRLERAGGDSVTVSAGGVAHEVPYAAIESAHTVFDWRSALAASRRQERPGDGPGRGRKVRRPAGRDERPGAGRGGGAGPGATVAADESGMSGEDDEERAAGR